MDVDRTQLIQELEELIEAIERRVPHIERAGERAIATEAAALKRKALDRLTELAKRPG